jgi:hypothetical protein
VFSRFAETLPKDWTVIHSTRLFQLPERHAQHHHPARRAEIDFLILHPRRGLLALEVKGGGVGRDDGGWYTENRYHQRHRIKDPGAQAERGIHLLVESLDPSRRKSRVRGHFPFGFGVVLPDVRISESPQPGLPRELILDGDDLRDPEAAIERVFEANGHGTIEPDKALERELIEQLAPVLHLAPSLSVQIDADEREFVRLTEMQHMVLDALALQRRLAVRGVAGSGKTMLAMSKAQELARQGQKVLLTCFNQPLAEHLARLADGFDVLTFHRLCRREVERSGRAFEVPQEAEAQREFFETTAAELLVTALEAMPDERYDAVLVDEGQDFRELWWPAVLGLLRSAEDSLLYVFWDPNQDLYGGGPPRGIGLTEIQLPQNCRNTARIARYAAKFVELELKLPPGAPEGVSVREITVADDHEMVDAVRKLVHEYLVEQKLDPSQLVILTPGAVSKSPVFRAGRLGNFELVETVEVPGPGQVRFSSNYRFKGLEADVVILCDVADGSRNTGPKPMHVATSRAKHVLAVVRRG